MPVNERDLEILEKILRYCDDIEFSHCEYHRNFQIFCANPTYRNSVALCLMQIGELSNRLSPDFKTSHPEIPWRAIRGMRNIVAHEYGKIDEEVIWETAENGVNDLREFCRSEVISHSLENDSEKG